jgi:uncharacterized protein
MNEQVPSYEVSSDDKLWALLAYIFSPLVPIIILLLEDKKNRPFLKAHNMQALILGAAEWIINIIVSAISFGILGCVVGLVFLVVNIYLGVKAYNGQTFEIPYLTNFIRQQGW